MNHDRPMTLLGGLTAQQFLSEYWQKKPLLIRQAIPDFQSPVLPDELAGMALEPDTNVRLIQEQHSEGPWHVHYAPLDDDIFSRLPASHWTFLVTDCEKHWPELGELIEPFRFIPDWRIDDLMISYAAPHGSVGPHIDEYDVFLLQLHGRREWQIQETPTLTEAYIDGIELKILQHFEPDQQWVLEPGDLLYLPPRFAHHGSGVDGDCMTASIGFRAPEQVALLQGFLEHQLASIDERTRYSDPTLQTQSHPSQIRSEHLDALWQMVEQALDLKPSERRQWLGQFLTQASDDHELPHSSDSWEAILKSGAAFERSGFARMAYLLEDHQLSLFANGEHYTLKPHCLEDVQALCDAKECSLDTLQQPEDMLKTILSLLADGTLDLL